MDMSSACSSVTTSGGGGVFVAFMFCSFLRCLWMELGGGCGHHAHQDIGFLFPHTWPRVGDAFLVYIEFSSSDSLVSFEDAEKKLDILLLHRGGVALWRLAFHKPSMKALIPSQGSKAHLLKQFGGLGS